MSGHTPLPWSATDKYGQVEITGADGGTVGTIFDGRLDAPLMVRAVNHHDRLVDVLRRHYSHTKACGHIFACVCLQDEVRALLAEVEV